MKCSKLMTKLVLNTMAMLMIVSSAVAAFPEKEITLIVPYNAGGGSDTTARIFAQFANKYFPKPIVVVNYPGGGGAVGQTRGSKAAPDGYTLTQITTSLTIQPYLKKLSYDYKSFRPIAQLVDVPDVLMVRKDNEKFSTAEQFIAYAKANPGKIRVGTSGTGSTDHFTMMVLQQKGGMKLTLVPFSGADAKVNLLGGHVDAAAGGPEDVHDLPDLKALMVFADTRFSSLPEVPTAKELGINWTSSVWRGIALPAGVPQEIVDYFDEMISKVMADPEYLKMVDNLGIPSVYMKSAEFTEKIKEKAEIYKALINKNLQ